MGAMAMMNENVSAGKMKKPSNASSTIEEIHNVSLQIEATEEEGSFVNRLLSREEGIGDSSTRSYYRPPFEGRVPFDWEAEPGKPKTGFRNEGESDHGIPALRRPPILEARNADHDLRRSSGGRRKVGLFQKIKEFVQGKTLTKSTKLRQRGRPTPEDLIRYPVKGKDKMRSQSVGRPESRRGSDWEIHGEDNAFIPFRYSVS